MALGRNNSRRRVALDAFKETAHLVEKCVSLLPTFLKTEWCSDASMSHSLRHGKGNPCLHLCVLTSCRMCHEHIKSRFHGMSPKKIRRVAKSTKWTQPHTWDFLFSAARDPSEAMTTGGGFGRETLHAYAWWKQTHGHVSQNFEACPTPLT